MKQNRKNIYLIGMMGSGKSTLGKLLAEKLSFTFIDTDQIIEKDQNSTINEIFHKHGETYFRKLESEALLKISGGKNLVVATGGGIILSSNNRDILVNTGTCVYLQTDIDVLSARLNESFTRPNLNNSESLDGTLTEIFASRKSLYEFTADITVNSNENINQTLINLLNALSDESI